MTFRKKPSRKNIQKLCSDVKSVFDDLNLEEEDQERLKAKEAEKRKTEDMLARIKDQIDDLS